MKEAFQSILSVDGPFDMVVLIFLISCGVGLLCAVAKEIRKYGCHRIDVEFKRELVERGLSGEEIERIIQAGIPEPPDDTVKS